MRKALIPAAVVAVAWVAAVVAQQQPIPEPPDAQPDQQQDVQENQTAPAVPQRPAARDRGGEPREATEPPSRSSTAPRRPPADLAVPPMEIGSRLEMFLMRPGRMIIRDTWRLGRIECRPWDNSSPGGEGVLRVHAVVAYVPDHPEERASGLELVLQDGYQDHTFLFDLEQLNDLVVALETVRTTAETMRDPPADVGRRAVYNLNGLEIGMPPRRSGGYLAPVGPDEPSVGLNPDNFSEMKRLLTEAQAVLKREAASNK
jgi:hypothetical protein